LLVVTVTGKVFEANTPTFVVCTTKSAFAEYTACGTFEVVIATGKVLDANTPTLLVCTTLITVLASVYTRTFPYVFATTLPETESVLLL
jgi:hypothetical protein